MNQGERGQSGEELDIFVPVNLRPSYEVPWADSDPQGSSEEPRIQAETVEIFCPQGYVVRISAGASAELVSQIMEALSNRKY